MGIEESVGSQEPELQDVVSYLPTYHGSLVFTLWAQREECGMQHPLAGPVPFDLLLTAPRRP